MLDCYFHNVSKEAITSFDRVKMKMKVKLTDHSLQKVMLDTITLQSFNDGKEMYTCKVAGLLI